MADHRLVVARRALLDKAVIPVKIGRAEMRKILMAVDPSPLMPAPRQIVTRNKSFGESKSKKCALRPVFLLGCVLEGTLAGSPLE
jgi:hypothetical protein